MNGRGRIAQLLTQGRAALVLTEVQPSIVGRAAAWPELTRAAEKVGLLGNSAKLAAAARAVDAPVVHCTAQHFSENFGGNRNARLFSMATKLRAGSGDYDVQADCPHADVWRDGDILLPRYHGLSAFFGTPLDQMLRNEGVTTIVLGGVSLCFGVLSMAMDAVNRGYQVIIPRDAVAGFPEDYSQSVLDNTLMMLAIIVQSDEIAEVWRKAAV